MLTTRRIEMFVPFNLNYPIERVRAHVQKTKIKQAVEEVFTNEMKDVRDQMQRIEVEVTKNQSPDGQNSYAQMSEDMKVVLQKAIDLTNKLNEVRATGSTDELADAKEKLRETLEELALCGVERNNLEKNNRNLIAQLKEARAEAAAARAGTEAESAAANKVRELEEDMKNAMQLVEAVNEDKEPDVFQSNVSALKVRQEKFVEEVLSVREKWKAAANDSETHALGLENVREELANTLRSLRKEQDKVTENEQQVKALTEKHQEAVEGLEKSHSKNFSTEVDNYLDKINNLNQEIQSKSAANSSARAQISELKAKVIALQQKEKELQSSLSAMEVKERACQQALEKLRGQVENPDSIESSSGDEGYGSPHGGEGKSERGGGGGGSGGGGSDGEGGVGGGAAGGASTPPHSLGTGVVNFSDAIDDIGWIQTFQNAMTRKSGDGKFKYGPYKRDFRMLLKFTFDRRGDKMKALGHVLTDKDNETGEGAAVDKEQRSAYHTEHFVTKAVRNVNFDGNSVNLTNTEAFKLFVHMRLQLIQRDVTLVKSPSENARLFLLIVGYFGLITPAMGGKDRKVHIKPKGFFTREKIEELSAFDLSNLFAWL